MRKSFTSLVVLLIFTALAAAQGTKVNPSTQIYWPAVTGSGAPVVSCSSLNYGQPYIDVVGNVNYYCSATGWIATLSSNGCSFPTTSGGSISCPGNATVGTAMCPSSAPVGSLCMNGTAYTPTTVSGLGAATAGNKYVERLVNDGNTASDCAVGGGTFIVKCMSNGTSWVSTNGSGGGTPGGSTGQIQFNNSGAFGGAATLDSSGNATLNNATLTGTFSAPKASLTGSSTLGPARLSVDNLSVFPVTHMFNFGDSVTRGAHLLSNSNAYPGYIAKHLMLASAYNNLGVDGSTAQSTDPLIFSTNTKADGSTLITYNLGINNARITLSDTNQAADFGYDVAAANAYLALNTVTHPITPATSFSFTGTWSAGGYTISKKTVVSGATATFTVTGSTVFLATVAQATANPTASATLSCDGNPTGATLVFTGAGGANITQGAVPVLAVATGLGNSTHSCVVTSTSTGTVELAWAAGYDPAATHWDYPIVLLGNIIPANYSPQYVSIFNTQISSAVTSLSGWGLKVTLVDVNSTLTPPANYQDVLHPSDYGQYLMSVPYNTAIDSILALATPLVTPSFNGATLYNRAISGNGNNLSIGDGGGSLSSGSGNLLIGYNTGANLSTGARNTVMGNGTGALTTGGDNVVIGYGAATSAPTSGQCSFIGSYNSQQATSCLNTVSNGYKSGAYATTLTQDVLLGSLAGVGTFVTTPTNQLTTSTNATFVGYASTFSVPDTGSFPYASGFGSLSSVGGAYGTALGALATAGYQNCTAVGAQSSCTAANQVMVGGSGTMQIAMNGTVSYAQGTLLHSGSGHASIAPQNGYSVYHVDGTGIIDTISPPTGCTNANYACRIDLIADGAWSTSTVGNIAQTLTMDVGASISMLYDNATTKWYPVRSNVGSIQITTGTGAVPATGCTTVTNSSMPGLTTVSAIIPPTPTSDVSGVTGWGPGGGLYFNYYVSSNTFNWKICNSTTSIQTPGGSITWNVGAR